MTPAAFLETMNRATDAAFDLLAVPVAELREAVLLSPVSDHDLGLLRLLDAIERAQRPLGELRNRPFCVASARAAFDVKSTAAQDDQADGDASRTVFGQRVC